jgi:hypothetical protein
MILTGSRNPEIPPCGDVYGHDKYLVAFGEDVYSVILSNRNNTMFIENDVFF